jgi:transposase
MVVYQRMPYLLLEETTRSRIQTALSQEQFAQYVEPYLSKAHRGFVSQIPLYKIFNYILYFLHTGCQWAQLPIDPDPEDATKKEMSYYAVYHHFRKWSKDGSLKRVWQHSILAIKELLDLSVLHLDGTHTMAKR